jgi:hypothetical protein
LGFRDGHPAGLSATPRFSDRRLRGMAKRRGPYRRLGRNRVPTFVRLRLKRLSALSCQYAVQGDVSVRRVGERTLAVRPLGRARPWRYAVAFGDSAKAMGTIEEAPKALRDHHHGLTDRPSAFVSFAAFCSNFLLFLLLSIDRSGSSLPRFR